MEVHLLREGENEIVFPEGGAKRQPSCLPEPADVQEFHEQRGRRGLGLTQEGPPPVPTRPPTIKQPPFWGGRGAVWEALCLRGTGENRDEKDQKRGEVNAYRCCLRGCAPVTRALQTTRSLLFTPPPECRVCARACVCVCVRACVHVCVCVWDVFLVKKEMQENIYKEKHHAPTQLKKWIPFPLTSLRCPSLVEDTLLS